MTPPLCPKHKKPMTECDGQFGPFFGCPEYPRCDMIAKRRPDGSAGPFSDKPTREWRKQAHEVFDAIWKDGRFTRSEAYAWMGKMMRMHSSKAHIESFDISQCRKLIGLVKMGVGIPPAPAQDGSGHGEPQRN